MEDLVDNMLKLKSENTFLRKLCKSLDEKISLENYHCKCTSYVSIMKN